MIKSKFKTLGLVWYFIENYEKNIKNYINLNRVIMFIVCFKAKIRFGLILSYYNVQFV